MLPWEEPSPCPCSQGSLMVFMTFMAFMTPKPHWCCRMRVTRGKCLFPQPHSQEDQWCWAVGSAQIPSTCPVCLGHHGRTHQCTLDVNIRQTNCKVKPGPKNDVPFV